MKLLHVIAGAPVGGAETFAQDAIVALAEQGIEQVVITRPHPGVLERYAAAGVRVAPRDFGLADRALGVPAIRREARALGADLVHAWMSRAASVIPANMPCPVIGWFGDYYKPRHFKRCDHFMAVTPDIVRYILAQGAPPHRAGLVNTFGDMPEAAPVDRASLDTPPDAPVILVLSRMHAVKGVDTMLTALAEVPGAYLWLAGDGPETERYKALSTRLGLGDRVRFLGWRNDRKALLEACDICALPSRYEPFGTVIVEAWAMKRPLAAAAAAGARQYVTHGETGLVSPIEDAPALAANLRRLIGEPDLRARLVEAGHAQYLRTFTRETVTARLIAYYQRAIALGPRSADGYFARVADPERAEALAARIANGDIPGARARAAAQVRLAYQAGEPRAAADATLLELSGAGQVLRRDGRILRIPEDRFDLLTALPLWAEIETNFGEAAARLDPVGTDADQPIPARSRESRNPTQ
jgi:glycosyltransferase involved in cell wall biosynthesis